MKVLLISHNCFSTHQSMGKTFLSLFSQFAKEDLCQLYVYPTIPDVDVCSSYYRITDKEALKGIFSRKRIGGEIDKAQISPERHTLFERAEDMSLYRARGNGSGFRRLLRDAMWKLSPWNNQRLRAWLAKEKPDCIFVAPGYAKFIYDMALKVSKICQIPIVTYICDDYYFVKTPTRFWDKVQVRSLQRKTDTLMKNTVRMVTISEEMREKYLQTFAIPTLTVMTGTNYPIATATSVKTPPTAISYFGNISCNRYISLAELGRALDRLNQERGTDIALRIYTASKDPVALQMLKEISSVRLCDFLSGKEFEKTMHAADLLLHTEAFDAQSVDLVRHSVSTKIADSLGSGIPLVAYGPDSVSSMKHLIRNDCALVATTKEGLYDMLCTALFDQAEQERAAKKALAVAQNHHNSERNSQELRRMLESL